MIRRCDSSNSPEIGIDPAAQFRSAGPRIISAPRALNWLMAWDPFNVTEDADLGLRLARNGYRCQVIRSTTYEEAPARFMFWLRQRTRWLKGFVQTWLVHMRVPSALWRELGPRGFLAFQIMVGGTVLSALAHPWFYVLAGLELAGGGLLARPRACSVGRSG